MAGNVAVRFSVEDQEVVRKALEDLGEQGKAALKKMDDSSKPASSGMKAISTVIDEIKGRMVGLAVPLGPVGSGLIALGPGGIAAAAGIGAAISAIAKLSEMANELASKSSRISNFAEQTGLSTDQVQALGEATVKFGKSQEETNAVIEKAATAWDELRRGQGTAFDQIRKIDPELLNQLASAKDLGVALEVLAKAYANAGDEAARIALSKAFGGKGGASTLGALLGGIGDAGNLANLTKEAKDVGSVVDKELIQRLSLLKVQIDQINEHSKNMFASMFAETTLNDQKEWAATWFRIVSSLSGAKTGFDQIGQSSFWTRFTNWTGSLGLNSVPSGITPLSQDPAERNRQLGADALKRGIGSKGGDASATYDAVGFPKPPEPPVPLAVQLRNMRDLIGLLGSAATPTEQLDLKMMELKKSVADGAISQADANRALAAYKMASDQAIEGTRERLGIATQDNVVTARMAQLRDAQAKGIIQSDAEFTAAERLVQREARQTAEAMEVRNSAFKGLKQLEIDGRDLSKSLDTGLTASLNGVENSLVDITTGTVSTSDGFKNMETQVIRSLEQMLIKMVITAQLAKALGAGLNMLGIGGPSGPITLGGPAGPTPFPSASGNAFSSGNVVPFALGGIVRRPELFPMANGGVGLRGEAGDEGVLPLTRINGKLGVYSAGGGGGGAPIALNVHVHNNTGTAAQASASQGPNGDITVMLDKMVDGAVGKSLSSGSGRRVLNSQFGVKPFTGS